WKQVAESTVEAWRSIIESNLYSVFYTTKFALPVMRQKRWGRIINLGAVGAERAFGQAKISAYSAAKAGLVAFTRSVALEEARNGITANVVNPPVIDEKELPGGSTAPYRRALSRGSARYRPRCQRSGEILCLG